MRREVEGLENQTKDIEQHTSQVTKENKKYDEEIRKMSTLLSNLQTRLLMCMQCKNRC